MVDLQSSVRSFYLLSVSKPSAFAETLSFYVFCLSFLDFPDFLFNFHKVVQYFTAGPFLLISLICVANLAFFTGRAAARARLGLMFVFLLKDV